MPEPAKNSRSVADSLAGRVAVVTGSTSGIGRAIAIALAESGADIVVHGRNEAAAKVTADAISAFGCDSKIILADLALTSEQDRLVDESWRWRPIDIWINNAGLDVLTGPAVDWSFDEKLARLWEVDVVATLRLSRAAGKRMLDRQRGVILNVGWDQAQRGMAGDSGEMFATTKGAIASFTLSLAQSLAPHVRVNCLAPGWIRTAWGDDASEYWQDRAKKESLVGRWGSPADIAVATRFLASDESAFITGQVININGGSKR